MKITTLIVFIFFLSISLNKAYAQLDFRPGYVIQKNNDTLSGFIAAQTDVLNCRQCLFRKTEDGISKRYLPDDIESFRFENGRYFISRSIELDSVKTLVFLEFLVNGASNLYYFSNTKKDYYFVEKNDSVYTELIYNEIHIMDEYGHERIKYDERYKGVLMYLYRDYPAIYPSVQSTHFDHNSLIKLSVKYHNKVCPDEECIVYSKSVRKRLFFGLKLGINYSTLGMINYSGSAPNLAMNIGIHFRFIPAKIYYRWNFLLGLEYSSVDYSNSFSHPEYSTIIWHVDIAYKMLRVPMKVQYTFPARNIQPSIFLGYDNIFILNPEYSSSGPHPPGELGQPNYQSGLIFGFVLSHEFKNKNRIFMECEYEYRRKLFYQKDVLDLHMYTHSFTLNIGIDFPIR